jgi:hypothetical protein
MTRFARLIVVAVYVALPSSAAASGATLFRLFLFDGTTLVSYGEYARVDDRVIFPLPVGGPPDDPRLHVVTVPSGAIDWARTERYAESVRYQRYLETRAEEDFTALTTEVARVLNTIVHHMDSQQALVLAEQARRTLAAWPQAHYGYREDDIRDILTIVDEAISRLRGATAMAPSFELSLVASVPPPPIEPVLGMPEPREQLDQVLRVAELTPHAADRLSLFHAALALLHEGGAARGPDAARLRTSIERRVREEREIDERYARLSEQLLARATQAATRARVTDVERVLRDAAEQDARLGQKRPEVMVSVQTALQAQLTRARQLRLRRDQWQVRQAAFREYRRAVESHLMQLIKAQPLLETIRRLDGPEPERLVSLGRALSGGADALERRRVPEVVQAVHELLVSAWRFAETAVSARYSAARSGNLQAAWEASSAAAGALMMLARAQNEIRALLEPPQ